jgi:hypothetical protein
MSAFARETFDRVCASRKFGTAIAAKIAIMATTMSNSIRVKPRWVLDLGFMEHLHSMNAFEISPWERQLCTTICPLERKRIFPLQANETDRFDYIMKAVRVDCAVKSSHS